MSKNKHPILVVVTLCFALLCLSLLGCVKPKSAHTPEAKAGILDLRKADFSSPIKLDGEWSLTWGVLQRPGHKSQNQKATTTLVKVPGTWSRTIGSKTKRPAKGVATYRLQILLPPKQTKPLILNMHRVTSAFELWVNGKLLASRGKVGLTWQSSVMEMRRKLVTLPLAEKLSLVVPVSNHRHRIGGLRRSWVLGEAAMMLENQRSANFVSGILPAILFSIGCLFFVLGGVRRESSWLWFGAFCLTIAARAALGNDALAIHIVFPWLDTAGQLRLEYISIFGITACTVGVFSSMFPKQALWRPVYLVIAVSLLLAASSAVLPLSWVLQSLPLFGLLSAVSTSIAFWIIVRAWLASEKLAGLILAAYMVAIFAFLHDYTQAMGLIPTSIEFAPASFLLLIFLQTYALALRFAESFDRIKQLSDKLKIAHANLQKTHELTLIELEEERQMGNYQLEELLGKGGMGEVWRASHRMLARPAAIKLILPDLYDDNISERLTRFEREAMATAQLRSPHTVELYDFGQSPKGEFYYAMELLDGIDLDEFVQQYGPMKPARVTQVLRQACLSLRGSRHRDDPSRYKACQLIPVPHGRRV